MQTFTPKNLAALCLFSGAMGCAVVTDDGAPRHEESPATATEDPGDGGSTGQQAPGSGGASAAGGMPNATGGTTSAAGGSVSNAAGGSTPVPDNGPAKTCVASGNPGDTLLFDDFEDGDATWFTNEPIFWELIQDETQAYRQSYPADDLMVAAGGCEQWANVLVEARIKMLTGSDSEDIAAVFVRLKDASNFYYVALQGDGKLKLKKRVHGSNSSIGTTYGDTIVEQNVWHTIGIEAVGPALNMYLDGVLVDRVDEPGKFSAVDTDLTAGLAGFGTLGNATAVFDDITVTQR